MTLVSIAARNALRNKFRTIMTVLGIAIAVLAFVTLRTILHAWNVGLESAAKDRLATRAKVSFVIPLPKRYIDDVAAVPGVKIASYANYFGGQWPKDANQSLATMAAADNIFDIYPEMSVAPAALAQWKADKKGAIIGDVLAKRLGIHVGDNVVLTGTIYPGDWEFTVDGLYTAPEQSAVDHSTFYFHWDYLNDGAPPHQKGFIGLILTRVDDPSKSAAVSRAIDGIFDDRDVQTATMSERAMTNSFLGGITAVLDALDFISIVTLLIMMLILGNTVAMGVRERTAEYGVLRALGFDPWHVRTLIVAETLTVSLGAAVLGCAMAYPLLGAVGRWFEENMGQFFPTFRVTSVTLAVALALSVIVGGLASLIPALRAGRIQVTDALREIA